jgi:hypothetical protein
MTALCQIDPCLRAGFPCANNNYIFAKGLLILVYIDDVPYVFTFNALDFGNNGI